MIRAVVALDINRGIGRAGGLPWGSRFPFDLARFKAITLGTVVIVGRRTRAGMPPNLPGRELLVVDSRETFQAAVRSTALRRGDIVVAGGAAVYGWAIEFGCVEEWHVTRIADAFDADVLCPDFEHGLARVADARGFDPGTRWEVWR